MCGLRRVLVLVGVLALSAITPTIFVSQTTDPELVRLRHEWAMRYFEPGPHMELAKYFRNKGNDIQAFYILENARRGRFSQGVFDAAYLRHFGGFGPLDNSPAEEQKYLALRKTSPDDLAVLKHLADIYVSREDYAQAEPLFRVAVQRDPSDFSSVTALAEIYGRQGDRRKQKQVLDDFERSYPTSSGSYGLKIDRVLNTDGAAARKLIDEALKLYPDAGTFWFYLAVLADRDKKIDEAAAHFVKAAELDKDSIVIQGRAAGFFRNQKYDGETALKYYLRAYFPDPHAHFDGFAEARVAGLNFDMAESRTKKLWSTGKRPEDFLSDPNPTIVAFALRKLFETWDGKDAAVFINLMRHDDVAVRWYAMEAITAKSGRSIDPRLKDLLKDTDLRVRGLAAYIAVKLWKAESFPIMRELLKDDAQVVRYDAYSALMMYGGPEGRQIVIEHRKRETNSSLNELIDRALSDNSR